MPTARTSSRSPAAKPTMNLRGAEIPGRRMEVKLAFLEKTPDGQKRIYTIGNPTAGANSRWSTRQGSTVPCPGRVTGGALPILRFRKMRRLNST